MESITQPQANPKHSDDRQEKTEVDGPKRDEDDNKDASDEAATCSQDLVPAASASVPSRFKELTSDQKILALLRQSILPFSDRLDPFAALPVHLDRLQEHLVSFYLLHYPKVTYGFSPRLRPHPVATNFSIALTTPACFQVILARSALYRLSLSKYAGEKEKKALEVVMMRHKGEALRLIRALSAKSSPTRKDDLIASIISLGTLDRRTGSSDAAGMHFMAVRRILKATGGPLAVRSLLLSRVMVFFECIYGTSPESYIWDESDLKHLLPELNAFFARIWNLWKQTPAMADLNKTTSALAACHREPYLQPVSALHSILTRPPGPTEPSETTPILPQHRLELMSQLTCLLTLAAIILDYPPTFSSQATDFSRHLSRSSHATTSTTSTTSSNTTATSSAHASTTTNITTSAPSAPSPSPTPPFFSLPSYLESLHSMVADLQLTNQPTNNVMWQIQINDHSEQHNRRVWKAASFAWVLKHAGWNVQMDVRGWLNRWMDGSGSEGEKRLSLESWHFSYAA